MLYLKDKFSSTSCLNILITILRMCVPFLKETKHKTTLDLYSLLAYRGINAHIEKAVFHTEGKLLHQVSDLS